jgi:hypothetical protein
VIPGVSDPVAKKLAIVRVGNPARRIEEHGNSSIRSVLVRSLQIETAAEEGAQAAPQIVDSSVGERDIGHALGASVDLVRRPEARVDVDRLEALSVPGDTYRAVCLHAPILPRAVLLARLSIQPSAIEDATLP